MLRGRKPRDAGVGGTTECPTAPVAASVVLDREPAYSVHCLPMEFPAIQIEVLYFEGCPNAPRAVELVREVVAALGVNARITEREMKDYEDAVRNRFLGSPTIRVEGVDVEPLAEPPAAPAFGCRLYGSEGVPPHELIERAIRERVR